MSLAHGRPTDAGRRTGDKLLPWSQVEQIIPYTRQHVARLEKAGQFPQRVQCGAARVAWWESEIMHWAQGLPRGPLHLKRQSETV